MLFGDAIDLLISRINTLDKTKDSDRVVAKNYFNVSLLEVYRAANWDFRKRTGQIVLIPNYTAGTCTVTAYDGTNDSVARTVSFSGATLIQGMVGRYFQVKGSQTWYKIISISGNTAYLDVPYVEASGAGLSFIIWKRFYYVKSEADSIMDFGSWERGVPLDFKSSTNFTDSNSNIGTTGNPSTFIPYGIDPYDDKTYSEGSISIAASSNIVAGVGTSFLSNADSGDILVVGALEYPIKRVESDSSIVLKNYVSTAVAPGSAYQIRKSNPLGFEFFYNTDQFRIVHYEYMAKGYKLLNDKLDYFYMPEEYLIAVWDRAESMIRRDKDDSRWPSVLQVYQAELDGLKLKKNSTEPRFNQFAPKIDPNGSGRT